MELFIPHTPLAIVITILLALLVCLKVFRDVKEIRSSRQAHSLIMKFVKKKNVPHVGVVIELRKTADTIIPLLDHLYEQNYKGLEIVVVIKHTAGKYAQSKLTYYRRKHQRKNLKIVKHTKGMDVMMLVRRHVSSPFVIQLQSQNTLSDNFFSDIATELLDEHVNVVIPRRHISPGKTVLSAAHAAFSIWQHMFTSLYGPHPTESNLVAGRVYRRTTLLESAKLNAVYAPRVAVRSVAETSWKTMTESSAVIASNLFRSGKVRVLIASVVIATVGLAMYIWNEDTLLFAEFIVGIYSAVYALALLGLKGYSLTQTVNLLLFAPFSLVFSILLGIYVPVTIFYNSSGLKKFSLRELAKYGKRRNLAIPKP